MAYKATPHKSTGFSPNFMMYGHELSMPVNVMLSLCPGEQYLASQHTQKLRKQHQFGYEMAQVARNRTGEKQTRLYNQSMFGKSMKAGDIVWLLTSYTEKESRPSFNQNGRVLVLSQKCIMYPRPNPVVLQKEYHSSYRLVEAMPLEEPQSP